MPWASLVIRFHADWFLVCHARSLPPRGAVRSGSNNLFRLTPLLIQGILADHCSTCGARELALIPPLPRMPKISALPFLSIRSRRLLIRLAPKGEYPTLIWECAIR